MLTDSEPFDNLKSMQLANTTTSQDSILTRCEDFGGTIQECAEIAAYLDHRLTEAQDLLKEAEEKISNLESKVSSLEEEVFELQQGEDL